MKGGVGTSRSFQNDISVEQLDDEGDEDSFIAVSYTHLDVYKRQAIISENRVRKREVVYVSDHSAVVKTEEKSRNSFYGNISFYVWF